MKTKEALEKTEVEWAIEYLETIKHDQWMEYHYINKAVPLIITMLKRGEKYEQMWEGDAKDWLGNDLDLEEWMNETKQRYFPKGVRS